VQTKKTYNYGFQSPPKKVFKPTDNNINLEVGEEVSRSVHAVLHPVKVWHWLSRKPNWLHRNRMRECSRFQVSQPRPFVHLQIIIVMSKSTKKRIKKQRITVFPILHPNAAGIDVSDSEMMVCVPGDRCEEPIQAFGTFTTDLNAVANHLQSCKIDTVAMESTGVYWVSLFLILQDRGLDVYLVNAKHVKNVTGRKDDEEDAAWIQRLHSCGLLNRSFQPDNDTRGLRSLVRHRKNLIQSQSSHVNRIEKTLELMNIKIHTVISDILGKSGMAILDAIINHEERDAQVLSQLTDPRIKADNETIIKSLEANWRDEHLFELRQYYELYQIYQEKIKKP